MGLSNVVAIAGGYGHSLALKDDGTLVAWGGNWAHQSDLLAGLTNVVAIASGGYQNLALLSALTAVRARFFGVKQHSNGITDLRLLAEPGFVYQVQSSANLQSWATRATVTNRTGGIYYLDAEASGHPARFYRTKLQ